MIRPCDVLVIGAGPAGTIAASRLLKAGFSVKILESAIFPRFVIGESLLPHSMDYLDELNLLKRIEEEHFQVKTGACFYQDEKRCDFLFENQFTKGWKYTYQVKRADFDFALAQEVERQGAMVIYNATVTDVKCSPKNQVTTFLDPAGEEKKITSKFVIDASGYGRVLPRLFDLEVPVETPPRGAVFAHFKDNNRSAEEGRNIFIHAFRDNTAWVWSIPFSDNTASVGVVGNVEFIDELAANNGEKFLNVLADFPELKNRYQAEGILFDPRVIRNYAVSVKQLHGPGYVLCGNSTEFLDPVFSSGVTLAISSGYLAASLVDRHLHGEDVDWNVEYSEKLRKGIDVFRSYVNAWYNGDLQTIFFSKANNETIKQEICSVLAGYVWDETNPFVKKHKKALTTLAKVIRQTETV